MNLKGIVKIAGALLFVVYIAGCGDSNSQSNGTLTLEGQATVNADSKTVTMDASALLTPIQVNSEVAFTARLFNSNETISLPVECSGTKSTNVSGVATISCNFPQPTVASTLQISATSGGLAAYPPVTLAIAAAQ